jgi:hypothetical protein
LASVMVIGHPFLASTAPSAAAGADMPIRTPAATVAG